MAKWEQLIALRNQLHYSQEETSVLCNVGLSTYQQWELGSKKPQPKNWRRLIEIFPTLDRVHPHEKISIVEETDIEPQRRVVVTEETDQNAGVSLPSAFSDDSGVSSLASIPFPLPDASIFSSVPVLPERTVVDVVEMTKVDDVLWTSAIQSTIRHMVKEFDIMSSTKNDQMTRRSLIEMLAQLPLGFSTLGSTIQRASYGDVLASCATALEACWELYWGSDGNVVLAFRCVSKYLPLLTLIGKDSKQYQSEAFHMATRYALLKTLLGRICARPTETIAYAYNAVVLSGETRDISLQLSAYTMLAWAYFEDQKYGLAWETVKEGERALMRYQSYSSRPPLLSSTVGSFYSIYALAQTKKGEDSDRALGIATDSEPGNDPTTFTIFKASTQWQEAGMVCCYKGDQSQAMKWLGKRVDLETLIPLIPQSEWGRIDTINTMVLSMLKSKERDLEKIIHHWTVAMTEARATRYETAFSQAVKNFEGMEIAFPGEDSVMKLRPLTIHWNASDL